MKCLVSSTCLLFQIIAMLTTMSTVDTTLCSKLTEGPNLLDQMENCKGGSYAYSSSTNPVFDLSNLTQAKADKILYKKNNDGTLDFTSPKSFEGHVKIIGNSDLKSISISTSYLMATVEIVGNKELNTLKLKEEADTKVTVILKGNKQLSMMSIRSVNNFEKVDKETSRIQEYHECSFNSKAVPSLADLEGCKSIDGNLIIDESTHMPNHSLVIRIKKIENGCLTIEKSNLTDSSFLDFLYQKQIKCTAGKPVIKNNDKLCLTSEQRENWKTVFDLTYTGKCPDRCTVDFAKKSKDATTAKCNIVVGDVRITGSGVKPEDLAHWDRVEELQGTLEIDGTNLENITIFNNLKKIINPSSGKSAISVTMNTKLTAFHIPKLTSLKMPSNSYAAPIYFASNNETFMFTEEEGKRWSQIAKGLPVQMPIYYPPKTLPPTTTVQTTTVNATPISREEQQAKVDQDEKQYIAMGVILVTVLCFLIIGAFVLGLWGWKRYKQWKRKPIDTDIKRTILWEKDDLKSTIDSVCVGKVRLEEEERTIADVEMDKTFEPDECEFMEEHMDSVEEKRYSMRVEALLNLAVEVPWRAPYIHQLDKIDVEKIRKIPLQKMTTKDGLFRHEVNITKRVVNPKLIPNKNNLKMDETNFDELKLLSWLMSSTLDMGTFFYKNLPVLEKVITCLQGDHYQKGPLATVTGPAIIVGDVHGSHRDLLTLLNMDPDNLAEKYPGVHPAFCYKWVFLGDYVDRGRTSLETLITVALLAKHFPDRFIALAGNHEHLIHSGELANLVDQMGPEFYQQGVVNAFFVAEYIHMEMRGFLHYFPVAALINGKIFCAHGGPTLPSITAPIKTIQEMYSDLPWPFISYDEYCGGRRRIEALCRGHAELFVAEREDKYTKYYEELKNEARKFMADRKLLTPAQQEKDPRFKNLNPYVTGSTWSDPSPTFTHRANVRNHGNSVGPSFVAKMLMKFNLECIIRGHEEKLFFCMYLKLLWSIYSNNDTAASAFPMDKMKVETDFKRYSGVVKICPDNTLHLALYSWSEEKKPDMDLLPTDTNVKRMLGKDNQEERKVIKAKQRERDRLRREIVNKMRRETVEDMIKKNPEVAQVRDKRMKKHNNK